MIRKGLPLSSPPEHLDTAARDRIRKWADSNEPSVSLRLGHHWVRCRDHHLARGTQFANWEAAFRNWLRKAVEFESARGDTAIRRGGRGEAAPVAQVLRLLQGGEK